MRVKLLKSKTLCKGKRVRLVQEEYLIDGREVFRDLVDFGEAVAIVPIKSDGKVVILRQYRTAVKD